MTCSITIDIRPAHALSRTEQTALTMFAAGARHPPAQRHRYVWADPHWHICVWHHDRIVGHLQLTEQRGWLAGQPLHTVGVSNVLTGVAYRGQGLATRALWHAQHFLWTTLDADVAMVWCAPHLVPFYAQRGWQLLQAPVTVAQPSGTIVWPDLAMVLPRSGLPWNTAPMTIKGYPW